MCTGVFSVSQCRVRFDALMFSEMRAPEHGGLRDELGSAHELELSFSG